MSSVVTTRALMSSAGSAAWWALAPPSALPPRAGANASSSSMQTTLGARARAAAKTPAGARAERACASVQIVLRAAGLGLQRICLQGQPRRHQETACSDKVVLSQDCPHDAVASTMACPVADLRLKLNSCPAMHVEEPSCAGDLTHGLASAASAERVRTQQASVSCSTSPLARCAIMASAPCSPASLSP